MVSIKNNKSSHGSTINPFMPGEPKISPTILVIIIFQKTHTKKLLFENIWKRSENQTPTGQFPKLFQKSCDKQTTISSDTQKMHTFPINENKGLSLTQSLTCKPGPFYWSASICQKEWLLRLRRCRSVWTVEGLWTPLPERMGNK